MSDAWSQRRVAWMGGVLVAAIAVLAAYDIWRSYRETIAQATRDLDVQARVIAEQTTRSLQAVDAVLRHLAEQHQRGMLQQLNPEELHAYLKEQAVGLVQVNGIAIFGPDGRGIGSSLVPPSQVHRIDLNRIANYRRLIEDSQRRLMIGTTSRSLDNERWVFPIGRRLEGPNGEFAGSVGASGRVDYFQDFYRDAYPAASTRIALLHRNGTLMARHPPADEALGREVPTLAPAIADAASGVNVWRNISPLDGVDQFGASRPVPDHPLDVLVTRDAAAVLGPWRAQAIGSALRTVALGTLAVFLMTLAMRQFARLKAAGDSLADSEQRYALAAAGSDVGVWDWDLVAGTAYESRRARELQGLPLEPETQPLAQLDGLLNCHPEDAPIRAAALQAHLDGKTPHYEVEYRVKRTDGQYGWIHVRALCIRDGQGRPRRIAGSVADIDERKRAEAALRQSEERYALAMTGSDEGHWLWDIAAGQIYVSARLAEIYGMDGGARTEPDTDYFDRLPLHPDDRAPLAAARQAHLDGRTPRLDHEYRFLRAGSGEVRWLHTRGQCFRDPDGRPLRMAGATVDITERKRTEEALSETQQRFATAMAGAEHGIWVWDFTMGLAFGSSRGREMLGLPPQPELQSIEAQIAETAGQVHPDDRARRAAAIADHLAGRTDAYRVDYRARLPDGRWRWMHAHGRCERDANGDPLRLAGSLTDIDDRKRAEEELRQSEERYALAMTGSNGGYWVWNTVTDALFVSDKINELMGLPADQPLVTTRTAFFAGVTVHPEDRERFLTVSADLMAGRLPRADYEYRIILPPPGGERWILTRAQRFEGHDGGDLRVAGVTVDITERKRAESERQRLGDQLRQAQKLEAIGTLAGGIAHDFNNILSAILGYGELAQKNAPEGTPIRRHIDATMAAGQRAKALVERILAFSRSGMGERVPVHVQSVVDEALDAVAGTLPAGITLARALDAGDAGVVGDPTQIHQVVMNLCANAVQAMRTEGRLGVSLGGTRLDTPLGLATSTLPPGDYLRLSVADTGSGIAPELLARIFDPFFTTKEVGVGTGLGLSLVHGIVTDLGGGIEVESRVGEGSRFTVYLPAQSGVTQPAPLGPSEAEHGQGQVVLLVDDEESLVRLGEETLAEIGYEPVGFTSPADALDALRADPLRVDVVLSDEAMPGMTGTELARAVRALRPDLPVVLASGYVTPAMLAQARGAGVREVLSKPLTGAEVARALAAALRGLNAAAK